MLLQPEQIDKAGQLIHDGEMPEFIKAHVDIQILIRDLIDTVDHYMKKAQDVGGLPQVLSDEEKEILIAVRKKVALMLLIELCVSALVVP